METILGAVIGLSIGCVLIYIHHLWLSYRQFLTYRGYAYPGLTFRQYLSKIYYGG